MNERRANVSANADWPLFTLHLKRTLVPLLIGSLGTYLTLIAVMFMFARAGMTAKAFRETLDVPLLMLLLVVAVPVGTGPFSRAFKEQHIVFLHALPISRARQWLALVASSAVSLAALAAVFVVIRPSLVKTAGDLPGALVLAGVVVVLFAAGTCFGIVVRHPVAVYAGSFVVLLLFIAVVVFIDVAPKFAFSGGEALGTALTMTVPAASLERVTPEIMTTELALLVIAFLALSLFTYVRGEVTLFRTQLRNVGLLVLAVIVIAFGAAPVVRAFNVRRADWLTSVMDVSANGRYVMERQYRRGFEWHGRLGVVDVVHRKMIGRLDGEGITDAGWRGNRLIVFRRDLPGFRRLGVLRPPHDALETYSPEFKLLSRFSGHGTFAGWMLDVRRDILRVATINRGQGAVFEIDHDGNAQQLAAAPATNVELSQSIAHFESGGGKSRVFRLDTGEARELPWYPAAVTREKPVIFRDVVYPDPATFVRVIEHDSPIARAAGDTVIYAVDSDRHDAYDTMVAVVQHPNGRGTLVALPPRAAKWSVICGDFKVPPRVAREPLLWEIGGGASITVDRGNRYAACADETGGQFDVRFYDPALDRSFDVLRAAGPNAPWLNIYTMTSRVLLFSSGSANGGTSLGNWSYEGGRFVPVPGDILNEHLSDGSRVVAGNPQFNGRDIVRKSPNGKVTGVYMFGDE
jgi:hypothetical protein